MVGNALQTPACEAEVLGTLAGAVHPGRPDVLGGDLVHANGVYAILQSFWWSRIGRTAEKGATATAEAMSESAYPTRTVSAVHFRIAAPCGAALTSGILEDLRIA